MGNHSAATRALRLLAAIGIMLGAWLAPVAAGAEVVGIDPKEIIPLREVRPGMKGYGLTVFKGTKVEQFQFEVLGVLPNQYMGKPLVLIRMSGGPITQRQANLIAGMSGSPCYLNGRLLGAFAFGNAWPKEPIGMVTPIEDMAEAFDPKLPVEPAGMSLPLEEGPRMLSSPIPGAPSGGSAPLTAASLVGDWMRPYPMAVPVTVSGVTGRNLDRLARWLQPFNMLAQPGAGANPELRAPPLGPGSAIGVSLATGDIEMTAFGTVTYRKGNRLLIFGHPLLGIGPAQLPITTAVVYDVFPGFPMSNKIASAGKIVGTTLQDRPFSVSAQMGPRPAMIPVTCDVEHRGTGRKKVFQSQIATHPLLVNPLTDFVCTQAIMNVHSVPGDTTATVAWEVKTDEFGTIKRENVVYGMAGVEGAAVDDMNELLRILSSNSFRRVPVREINVKVLLEGKRNTATVERIFVPQDKYAPGETVEVGVVLRPYRGEPFVTRTKIRIPQNAANGRATLTVSGGPPRPVVGGVTLGAGGQSPPQSPVATGPTATSVTQLLRRFLEREKNDQLVTRIVLPSTTVNVAGEKLSLLPQNLAEIMRSSKTTGVRLDREEVRSAQTLDNVLSGMQVLNITIEREDHSETRSPSTSGSSTRSPSSGSDSSGSLGNSIRSLGLDDEEGFGTRATPLPGRPRRPADLSDEDEDTPRATAGHTAASVSGSPATPRAATAAPQRGSTAPGAATAGGDRPVGRTAATWRQTTQADFERGTPKSTAVAATGEVRLAPTLRVLYESPEQYLWSVAAAPDAIYAGSGNSGLVFRVTPSGEGKVFFKTRELEVHALARDKAGNLYAGTSPNGKIFRITPAGEGKEILSLTESGPEATLSAPVGGPKFVLALAVGPDGSVYAGTGPEGRVYRIDAAGKTQALLSLEDRPVQSLCVAPDGTVFAGTAEGGLIYAIAPGGRGRVLYQSDQAAITSLARAEDGTLYAGTAPKGIVSQISPEGDARVLWDKTKSAVQALELDAEGVLYAASGNVIYRIRDRYDVTLLTDSARAQFVALTRDSSGAIVAASANVGSLYRLETAARGVYESPVHDAKVTSRWGTIRWSAALPAGAGLQVETRSGDTKEPDGTWSEWKVPIAGVSDHSVASPPARYLQYRITLTAGTEGAPVLRDLTVHYLPRNQAPTVTLAAPAGGELLRGTFTVRWSGSDPDRDTLAYELFLSSDDGKSWQPVGQRLRVGSGGSAETGPAVTSGRGSETSDLRRRLEQNLADNPALARFRQAVEDDPELSEELRAEALQRAEALIAGVGTPAEGRGLPAPAAAPSGSPQGSAGGSAATTRETSLAWDTTQIPDGVYRLKVFASDRVSNPGSPLTAEAMSEPVRVANRAPWLYLFKKSVQVRDERVVTLDGLAQSSAPLRGAQYRTDRGEWTALEAADGIWDSEFEAWTLTTPPLRSGSRTLEVKVIDAAGNATVRSLSLPAIGR